MASEIFEFDAAWAEKWTKTGVPFLSAPTVQLSDIYVVQVAGEAAEHPAVAGATRGRGEGAGAAWSHQLHLRGRGHGHGGRGVRGLLRLRD